VCRTREQIEESDRSALPRGFATFRTVFGFGIVLVQDVEVEKGIFPSVEVCFEAKDRFSDGFVRRDDCVPYER
jgi:hypothetical protein